MISRYGGGSGNGDVQSQFIEKLIATFSHFIHNHFLSSFFFSLSLSLYLAFFHPNKLCTDMPNITLMFVVIVVSFISFSARLRLEPYHSHLVSLRLLIGAFFVFEEPIEIIKLNRIITSVGPLVAIGLRYSTFVTNYHFKMHGSE